MVFQHANLVATSRVGYSAVLVSDWITRWAVDQHERMVFLTEVWRVFCDKVVSFIPFPSLLSCTGAVDGSKTCVTAASDVCVLTRNQNGVKIYPYLCCPSSICSTRVYPA